MKKIEELEKKLSEIQNELTELKKQPKSRYPKSEWIELWGQMEDQSFYAKIYSRKYFLFAALIETCKEWNRIDGFEPDWTDYDIKKFGICNVGNRITIESFISVKHPICLKDKETAKLFLDTYRDEIEQVKDLL